MQQEFSEVYRNIWGKEQENELQMMAISLHIYLLSLYFQKGKKLLDFALNIIISMTLIYK